MEQFDFKITTDLSVINPQEITCNFEETKAWLAEALAPYKGLIVAEDAISDAKATRAKIHKVRDAIDNQRRSVEKEWNKPLARFKEQAKELAFMCDEAAENIDGQIKAYQKKKADEKIERLKARYSELSQGFEEYASWDFVFNPRWANVTFSEEDAEKEIMEKISGVQQDLLTIENLGSDFEAELLLEYAASHALRTVLEKERKLKEIRAASASKPPEPEADPTPRRPAQQPKGAVKRYTIDLHIEGDRQQLVELREFLDSRGMTWQKI